jgi:hypothetical protein
VTPTHAVADGLHGAIVHAEKPLDWSPAWIRTVDLPKPTLTVVGSDDGCCGGGGCC